MGDLFSLAGQTAVVTGAARGIGRAMALGLAEAGADIILILVRRKSRSFKGKACERNTSRERLVG